MAETDWTSDLPENYLDYYAARWIYAANDLGPEPTDEALSAAFANCAVVPPPSAYDAIRERIAAGRIPFWRNFEWPIVARDHEKTFLIHTATGVFDAQNQARYARLSDYFAWHDYEHPGPISRRVFEQACTRFDLPIVPDEALLDGSLRYMIDYGDFNAETDPTGVQWVTQAVYGARLRAIQAQHERVQAGLPYEDEAICDGCGGSFPESVMMFGSLGSYCPDCYDVIESKI